MKKIISLITALAMVLGISFTALHNKVHAAETISIPIYVTTDVGEVEITVSNGSDKVSETVSEDGKITLEIGKKDSGKYTIIAEQKELYQPDYDIVFKPETNDNQGMELIYSTIKEKEVNEEGFEANMKIEAEVVVLVDADGNVINFKHNKYDTRDVVLEIPAKDLNDMVSLNQNVIVDANSGMKFTDYNLKLNMGDKPLNKVLPLNFALYYKPNTVINKADTDYQVVKASLPKKYNRLAFSGDAIHKFFNNFYINFNAESTEDYKIGILTGRDALWADGEAYLTVIPEVEKVHYEKFANKVLAETLNERDAKTESLDSLRSSNQDYKDLYAPEGGTILINWPQEEKKDKELKVIKTCLDDKVESSTESAIFEYTIEPTIHGTIWAVHIFDKFDAPKGATVKYIRDSIKLNGFAVTMTDSQYENFCSKNGFEFDLNILANDEDFINDFNKMEKGKAKVTISYSVEVDKYGDYTNTAKMFWGEKPDHSDEIKVAEDSAKATLKEVKKKEETYQKTKRDDIIMPDKDYDKAIINYQNPFFEGYDENNKHIFKPENSISRAEIATVFTRILGIEKNAVKNPNMFSDLSKNGKNHWAKNNIIILAEYGSSKNKIINGYQGKFDPEGSISRAEFAKMIATYWDIKGFQPNINNADIQDIKEHWAKDYIRALYNHRFVDLYNDKSFKPDQKLKRSEVAQILNRITDRPLIKLNVPLYNDVQKHHDYYDEIDTASSVSKK